ncbi:hypothetical protein [Sphaerisporangium rufum]|uniref:hypothetical protein n=1 Tax=Sphaerisporangium rufum TaxID=1381558 RepID=UPI001EF24C93|nr:hypothetical protein [Sphaerisporangium rufum]
MDGGGPVDTQAWLLPDCSELSLAATVEAAGRLWRCDMDPDRRHLLAALPFVPAVLGDWLTEWAYGTSGEPIEASGPAGRLVGRADVERIDAAWRAFAEIDHRFGGGLVRAAVVDHLHSSVMPLLKGRYDERVGAALLSAAARLTQLAGWTAFDLGRHGAAQQYFGQALRLAKAADDPQTAAWVMTAMTYQAIHLGQGSWAVRLAGAATETARRAQAPPEAMALLLGREAWALSLHRAGASSDRTRTQVERLLAGADQACADGTGEQDGAWMISGDPTTLASQQSRCWTLLGDHRRGVAAAERALAGLAGGSTRALQLARVNAAEAYLGLGEVDQAVEIVRSATSAAGSLSSTRLAERIHGFVRRLEPYAATVQVKEFRAYLAAALAS